MNIRAARLRDIEYLIPLAIEMHAESRFSILDFDPEKTVEFMAWCIEAEDCILVVAEDDDGDIVGGIAAYAMEQWFSRDKASCDFALFVRPDKRGSAAAVKLISYYVGWAKQKGVKMIQIGLNTGYRVDETGKFYEALGFECIGYLYEFSGGA